jgi:hypothetical protein
MHRYGVGAREHRRWMEAGLMKKWITERGTSGEQ